MKFAPLILLLLVGCEVAGHVESKAQQPTCAPAANQVGHITPIQLPENEVFHSFVAVGGNGFKDRYIVTMTTKPAPIVFTLRDENGNPIIVVKNGRMN